LLADDTSVGDVDGRILLQRWLFTKAQETNADGDEAATDLLFHQTQQAIETGHLYCGSKKKESLKAAATSEDKLKVGNDVCCALVQPILVWVVLANRTQATYLRRSGLL
jgi:hypothetical protein